jgi:dipeptidyl aminopeptidase/acylaminoacyl peptidase
MNESFYDASMSDKVDIRRQCIRTQAIRVPKATRTTSLLPFILGLLIVLLVLTGCSLLPTPTNSAVVRQGHGLPTLRLLNWGFAAIHHPVWSPDGRWIAVIAGEDFAGGHVEVVSPDGQTRYDLSGWGCGEGPDPDYAWLPDGHLSCINRDAPYPTMCIGTAPFTSCTATRLTAAIGGGQRGLVWTSDGQLALFSAWPNDAPQDHSDLYVLSADGSVRQKLPFSDHYGVALPSFRPHVVTETEAQLAYCRGAYVDTGGIVHFDLVISTVTVDATGKLVLGPARTLATEQIPDASGYAWSPSGQWLAINHNEYHGGDASEDKIVLINADNPKQMIDVVQTDLISMTMNDPIWSPDGKTLIVFGGFGQQPYAIDIASYLVSKGLQP